MQLSFPGRRLPCLREIARAALLALCVAVPHAACAQLRGSGASTDDTNEASATSASAQQSAATPDELADPPPDIAVQKDSAAEREDTTREETSLARSDYHVSLAGGPAQVQLLAREGKAPAAELSVEPRGRAGGEWTCNADVTRGLRLLAPGGGVLPAIFPIGPGPEVRIEAEGAVPADARVRLMCRAGDVTAHASVDVLAARPAGTGWGVVKWLALVALVAGALGLAVTLMYPPARRRVRRWFNPQLGRATAAPNLIPFEDDPTPSAEPNPLVSVRGDLAELRRQTEELRTLIVADRQKPVDAPWTEAPPLAPVLDDLQAQVRSIAAGLRQMDEAQKTQIGEVSREVRALAARVESTRPPVVPPPAPTTPPISASPSTPASATVPPAATEPRRVQVPGLASEPAVLPQLAALLPKLGTRDRKGLAESLEEKLRQLAALRAVAAGAASAATAEGSDASVLQRFEREHRSLGLWISYLKDAIEGGFLPLIANLQASNLDEDSVARRIAADMRGAAQLLAGEATPVDERMDRLVLDFLRPLLGQANRQRAEGERPWIAQLREAIPLEPIHPGAYDSFKPDCHEDVYGAPGQNVKGVVAPGYRFRGQVLLRAVVTTDGGAMPMDQNATLAAVPIVGVPRA
jgi:hypothetical protein